MLLGRVAKVEILDECELLESVAENLGGALIMLTNVCSSVSPLPSAPATAT
jgi:hypothetical protein